MWQWQYFFSGDIITLNLNEFTINLLCTLNYTFLIIDDDPIFNFVLKRSFELLDERIVCTHFADADKALAYIESVSDSSSDFPSLILIDINMPLKSGFEFIYEYEKKYYTEYPDCVLYFLSSSIRESDKKKALEFRSVGGFYSKANMMDIAKDICGLHFESVDCK